MSVRRDNTPRLDEIIWDDPRPRAMIDLVWEWSARNWDKVEPALLDLQRRHDEQEGLRKRRGGN